jgi:hypothetical protein
VGLKTDGTVVTAGNNFDRQWNVSGRTGIIQIVTSHWHKVSLRADGTMAAVGHNDDRQTNVSGRMLK